MWSMTAVQTAALLSRIAIAMAAVVGPAEVKMPPVGAPLPRVPTVRSAGGLLSTTVVLDAVRIAGPTIDLTTRAYNGSIPGPTLAVNPGDRLEILLSNHLQSPDGPDAANKFHHMNSTSLHLHGLHVSPNAPSDDVLYTNVRPGASYQHKYQILPEHSPGTYWYHAHHAGSSMIQSGAGVAGALLVMDPPGHLPKQIESFNDRVLVLQSIPKQRLQKAAVTAGDSLFRIGYWKEDDEIMLVNGVLRPVLDQKPGEWQRLRFIGAGVSTWLSLDFGLCDAALLAKDGIYIADFPRFIRQAAIPPGGRADLVLRCPPGDHLVSSRPPPTNRKVLATFTGDVFTVRVRDGPTIVGLSSQRLEGWSPPRPRYLEDLVSKSTPQCSCSTALGLTMKGKEGKGKTINNHLYEGPTTYLHSSPRGAAVQRRLFGTDLHVYHQHTYPFQLVEVPSGDPFFKVGDWQDTYINIFSSEALVRFHTADFSGQLVVHCHDLSHADQGQLAVELVSEGGSCACDLVDEADTGLRSASLAENQRILLKLTFFAFFAMVGVSLKVGAMFIGKIGSGYVPLPEA